MAYRGLIQKAVLKTMFIFAVLFSGTEVTYFSFNVTGYMPFFHHVLSYLCDTRHKNLSCKLSGNHWLFHKSAANVVEMIESFSVDQPAILGPMVVP